MKGMLQTTVIQLILGMISIILILSISTSVVKSTGFVSKMMCRSNNEVREIVYALGKQKIEQTSSLTGKKIKIKEKFREFVVALFPITCKVEHKNSYYQWKITNEKGNTIKNGILIEYVSNDKIKIQNVEYDFNKGKLAFFKEANMIVTKPGTTITGTKIDVNGYQIIVGDEKNSPIDFFEKLSDQIGRCSNIFLQGTADPLLGTSEPNPYSCNTNFIQIINEDEQLLNNITIGDVYDYLRQTKKNKDQTYLEYISNSLKYCYPTKWCKLYDGDSPEDYDSFTTTGFSEKTKVCVPLLEKNIAPKTVKGYVDRYLCLGGGCGHLFLYCFNNIFDEVYSQVIKNDDFMLIGYSDDFKNIKEDDEAYINDLDLNQRIWNNCNNSYILINKFLSTSLEGGIQHDGVVLC